MVKASTFFSTRLLWVSGLLTVFFQITIGWILRPVGTPLELLQQQITLDPAYFRMALQQWGPEKVRQFLSHYYFDYLYPLVYSYFLAACIYRIYYSQRRWLIVVPFIAGLLDIVENSCQMLVILNRVPTNSVVFYMGAYSARIKWLLIFISIIIIGYGLIKRKIRTEIN